MTFNVSCISSSEAIPVEIIIGLPFLKYALLMEYFSSYEATLYAGTLNLDRKSQLFSSNGVLKQIIPIFLHNQKYFGAS